MPGYTRAADAAGPAPCSSRCDSRKRANNANSGGGIFNGGPLTITDSTLSGNSAINDGGGITNWSTLLTIANTTSTTRSITCITNCTTNGGWYADLPDTGERVNVDMKLQLGTLTVASNVPQNNACNIGGYSWLNFFDARNGLQVAGSANFSTKLSDSLAVGINVVRLPDGRTVVIATTSDASQQTAEAPIPAGDPQGRRTSWRELVQ